MRTCWRCHRRFLGKEALRRHRYQRTGKRDCITSRSILAAVGLREVNGVWCPAELDPRPKPGSTPVPPWRPKPRRKVLA